MYNGRSCVCHRTGWKQFSMANTAIPNVNVANSNPPSPGHQFWKMGNDYLLRCFPIPKVTSSKYLRISVPPPSFPYNRQHDHWSPMIYWWQRRKQEPKIPPVRISCQFVLTKTSEKSSLFQNHINYVWIYKWTLLK